MDTRRMFVALVLVAVGGFGSTPANAQSVYCEMVTAAIGAAVGYTVASPVGGVIEAMSIAAGAAGGSASFAGRCERSLEQFGEHYQNNPVDTDAFVRDQCNGNPLNCPGNFDPYNPWTTSPFNCSLTISCSAVSLRGPTGPFSAISVNDLIDAVTFVGISVNNGYWATDTFGYLVNLDDGGTNYTP